MRTQITPGQDYIVLEIDEVEVANRLAHCLDKTKAAIVASFREAPGGVLRIPAKGENWTAKRQGWIWHLEHRLDSAEEHEYVATNMTPGDARLSADGVIHVLADSVLMNNRPAGATTRDIFSPNGVTTVFTLSATPVHMNTVQAFVNGLLKSPADYMLSGKTLTLTPAPAAGALVVFYETLA